MEASASDWVEPNIQIYGPRNVRVTASVKFARRIIRFLLASVLTICGFLCARDLAELRELGTSGKVVQGIVYDKRETSGKSHSYYLDYRLTGPSGEVLDSEKVNKWEYDSTPYGGAVSVTVLPANYRVHRYGFITNERIEDRRTLWLFGTIFAVLIIEIVNAFFLYEIRRQTNILTNFVAVPARVVDVGPASKEKIPQYAVTYDYRKIDGKSATMIVKVDSSSLARIRTQNPLIAFVPPRGGSPELGPLMNYVEILDEPS